MRKALWAVAALAALALGVAIFGSVLNNTDVHTESGKVSAIAHQESLDRKEIANLKAELNAKSAAFLEGGQQHR
jgi:hypothetical protein